MTEARKEALSALIDGEASEIEVHRLAREFEGDESLTESWALYQHIRMTVRSDRSPAVLDRAQHRTLLGRISASIEAEDSHSTAPEPASNRGIIAGSLALAASLVVAVFIGVQQPDQATSAPGTVAGVDTHTGPAISATPVSTVERQFSSQAPELVELDEEKQRQLRA